MGAVYCAFDKHLNQRVAVKILKPDVAAKDSRNIELFEREVKAAMKLSHPHIVAASDVGTTQDGIAFLVMEWLEGQTLEVVLEKEKLSLEQIENIFKQVCEAIAAAHREHVLHLDIKPANIYVMQRQQGDYVVKIIDFGMAKVIANESGTTVTQFGGTFQYCSPEHFNGKLTTRSDIYSLGLTLYHLIAGRLPIGASYIYAKQLPDLELPALPSLQSYREDMPEKVERVIQKSLSKKPDDRQSSVDELLQEFLHAIRL
jgi:serine/threonine-protein kinase